MKFYHYSQNNSGGVFNADMPHNLIIEAESADDADRRAEDAGAYFDGVNAEQDCECCGDRWYRTTDSEACDEPCMYSEPVLASLTSYGSYSLRSTVRIVYANGARIDIKYVKE
jgi:hypothetical protein